MQFENRSAEPRPRADAGSCSNGYFLNAAHFLNVGKKHRGGIVARAQYAQTRIAFQRSGGRGLGHPHPCGGGGIGRLRIGEQDAQEGLLLLAGDQFVRVRRLGDVKAVGDQRMHVQPAGRKQIDKGSQIAAFGPTDIAVGVIATLLLVSGIITAGAVGA